MKLSGIFNISKQERKKSQLTIKKGGTVQWEHKCNKQEGINNKVNRRQFPEEAAIYN